MSSTQPANTTTQQLLNVSIIGGRAPHGLTGIVYDEVEARIGALQVLGEALHAGRVQEVQPIDMEPVTKVREIGLGAECFAASRGKRVVTSKVAPARKSFMPA